MAKPYPASPFFDELKRLSHEFNPNRPPPAAFGRVSEEALRTCLKNIIDADDAQALTQEHIEFARCLVQGHHPLERASAAARGVDLMQRMRDSLDGQGIDWLDRHPKRVRYEDKSWVLSFPGEQERQFESLRELLDTALELENQQGSANAPAP